MNKTMKKSALTLAIIASLGLSGCIDSGSDDSSSQTTLNKTTTGVITGFGSVFVNGVEYETDSASINIDGTQNAAGDDSGLKLGMVVTLSGDASGETGTAVSIEFNDEVEGIVTATPAVDGALKIMGLTIKTDEDTVFESQDAAITTIDQIELGNVIEVSGYSAGDGVVWATRLELKKTALEANDEVNLKGLVTQLSGTTFMIGDMLIDFNTASLDEDIDVLANDMLVKVKSDGTMSNGALVATEVELKSKKKNKIETDGDDDEVEVEGVITSAVLDSVFEVNGAPVTFDTNTRFVHGSAATLNEGYKVKVKGVVDAATGDFIAQTIVFKPTGDIKLAGPISSADAANNTINMFGLTIKLANETFVKDDIEDDSRERVKYLFGADDLVANDWLKIKAYKNSLGELVATKMVRKTVDSGKLSKLKGKVDSIDATDSTLIVLSGVSVNLGNSGITPVLGNKLELKGTYDETLNVFNASEGETASDEGYYIGGDDAEENEVENHEKKDDEDKDMDSNAQEDDMSNDMEDDNDMESDNDMSSNDDV